MHQSYFCISYFIVTGVGMYRVDISLTTLGMADGSLLPFLCWESKLGDSNAATLVLEGRFDGLDIFGTSSMSPIVVTTRRVGPFLAICLIGMHNNCYCMF